MKERDSGRRGHENDCIHQSTRIKNIRRSDFFVSRVSATRKSCEKIRLLLIRFNFCSQGRYRSYEELSDANAGSLDTTRGIHERRKLLSSFACGLRKILIQGILPVDTAKSDRNSKPVKFTRDYTLATKNLAA
jgi:hypothetical protein